MRIKALAVLLVASWLTPAPAWGQGVPTSVTFTGRLIDNGLPVTGSHSFQFGLFASATGGTAAWQESYPTLLVEDGLVYATLGAMTSLDSGVLTGATLYLEVTVDNQLLSPRVAIVSVPYAIRAGTAEVADTVGGFAPDDLQARVTGFCAPGQFIERVNLDGSVSCAADSGDVSEIATGPGSGLAGGVTAGSANLTLVPCAPDEILKYGGSGWVCAANAAGAPYTGASPIAVTGTSIGLSSAGCSAGDIWQWNGAAWDCGPDADTVYTGLGPISVTGSTISMSTIGCTAGELWRYDGASWGCVPDQDAGGDITDVVPALGGGLQGGAAAGSASLGIITCLAGQVLRYGAGGWGCSNDLDSGGDLTSVTTAPGSGIVGGAASGDVNLGLQTCVAGQVLKYVAGLGWQCGDDADTGDVTGVIAGAGLSGGGTSGDVTMGVAFAGSGAAATAARSDHQHDLDSAYIQNQSATTQNASFSISGNANVGGNVGIATASPAYKLHVGGDLYLGNSPSYLRMNWGSPGHARISTTNDLSRNVVVEDGSGGPANLVVRGEISGAISMSNLKAHNTGYKHGVALWTEQMYIPCIDICSAAGYSGCLYAWSISPSNGMVNQFGCASTSGTNAYPTLCFCY